MFYQNQFIKSEITYDKRVVEKKYSIRFFETLLSLVFSWLMKDFFITTFTSYQSMFRINLQQIAIKYNNHLINHYKMQLEMTQHVKLIQVKSKI